MSSVSHKNFRASSGGPFVFGKLVEKELRSEQGYPARVTTNHQYQRE